MPEHKHQNHDKKRRVRVKVKDTPGVICIESSIHDEAVVISGSLTLENGTADLNAWISEELEKAALAIKDRGGTIGHIKAAVSMTATDMISVTDENATVTRSSWETARIALAAIMFSIETPEAESIIRKALADVRARLREEKVRRSE